VKHQVPLLSTSSGSSVPLYTLRAASKSPAVPRADSDSSDGDRVYASVLHEGRLFVLRGPSGDVNSVGVGVVAVEETPIAADFYTENEIAILTKPSTGGNAIASVLSYENVAFHEVMVQEANQSCVLDVASVLQSDGEVVGTPYPLPTGQFNRLAALGSKRLCCAYASPKRLVVFEPEPEEDEDDDEEDEDE